MKTASLAAGRVAAMAFALSAVAGCRSQPPDSTGPQAQRPAVPPPSAPASQAPSAAADAGAARAEAGAEAGAPRPVEEALAGATFTKEIRAAFRVAACAGDDAWIPPQLDRKIVDTHCQMLTPAYAEYRK